MTGWRRSLLLLALAALLATVRPDPSPKFLLIETKDESAGHENNTTKTPAAKSQKKGNGYGFFLLNFGRLK